MNSLHMKPKAHQFASTICLQSLYFLKDSCHTHSHTHTHTHAHTHAHTHTCTHAVLNAMASGSVMGFSCVVLSAGSLPPPTSAPEPRTTQHLPLFYHYMCVCVCVCMCGVWCVCVRVCVDR